METKKGHTGSYSGNHPRHSMDHAHTRVDASNYKASERDDAAHISYLKKDVEWDAHHGHSDENMTADEKHISKLAGDMKYDKEHHGSPAHQEKKPSKKITQKIACAPGFYKNSKGDCVPRREDPGSKQREINKKLYN